MAHSSVDYWNTLMNTFYKLNVDVLENDWAVKKSTRVFSEF